MKFENCDIHDNILIDKAVVLPNGQVIAEQDYDEGFKGSEFQGSKEGAAKRGRKPMPPRIVTDTYTYKWIIGMDSCDSSCCISCW